MLLSGVYLSGVYLSSGRLILASKSMNSATKLPTIGIVAAALAAGIAGFAAQPVFSAEPAKPTACSASVYKQFDFWVGDWDAFDRDNPNKPVARTRVTRILDGCVLLEIYEGTEGFVGQSFTIYDASRDVWHQTWVTNRGELLNIEGGFRAGEMALSGVDRTKDGGKGHVRGTWKPVSGGVRETAVTSTDGGKTWNPWFDLVFRPHKS